MNDPLPTVVEVDRSREGKPNLYQFECRACGGRSGQFSLRESAESAARTHVKDRCRK